MKGPNNIPTPIRWVQGPDPVFIDNATLSGNLRGVKIRFGALCAAAEPQMAHIRIYAYVVMTPSTAKSVHRVLGEVLAHIEAEHGEIKEEPPNV